MIIKIIGAGMVFAASTFYAERILSLERKRIDHLNAIIDLITYIKNQIDLYSMPLEKIYKSIDPDKQKKLCLDAPPNDFLEVLCKNETFLDDDTKKVLLEFSSSLGKGYREMQLKLCGGTLAYLTDKKKALVGAFPSRKKTVLAICLGIGGVVLIALI